LDILNILQIKPNAVLFIMFVFPSVVRSHTVELTLGKVLEAFGWMILVAMATKQTLVDVLFQAGVVIIVITRRMQAFHAVWT